ncbi:zf-HC2 domain-containing protein [Myxococcota bacterium]|nr:zf-HC2 domain-containing protein [Myxococcota bacterium]MBU1432462.1 zf-HC2 domain-containing protein [Myxococcota bacterium]
MSCRPDLLAAHFEGRITPEEERALRAHLLDCGGCRGRYEGWSRLAALDPALPSLQDRLAVGLGLAPAIAAPQAAPRALRLSLPKMEAWGVKGVVAGGGLSALALLIGLSLLGTPPTTTPRLPQTAEELGLRPRGGDLGVGFAAFKLEPRGALPVSHEIRAQDGLAFAYDNRAQKQRLMIFAVDASRNVYWYHPAWTDPADNPTAILIQGGAERHELDEAVAHALTPGPLWVHALFTDAPLTVRDIEARLGDDPAAPLGIGGVVEPRPIALEVRP